MIAIEEHIKVLAAELLPLTKSDRGRLTVAVDCCNGACSLLSPLWLESLGCEVLAVNNDPTAAFPHPPEPKPETMAQLCAVVKAGRADIGFAHDADGERLGIVTDLGEPLSEEMTLALATEIRLRKKSGTVSQMFPPRVRSICIAAASWGKRSTYPGGQAYISEGLIEHNGVLGGEGSGGITVPEVHLTHDSAAAIGLILEHLAQQESHFRTGGATSSLDDFEAQHCRRTASSVFRLAGFSCR